MKGAKTEMSSRRSSLESIDPEQMNDPNAGLWLDKFIRTQGGNEREISKNSLVEIVSSTSKESDIYRRFYDRWKESLKKIGAETAEGKVIGRIVVGIGDESVLETSITLNKTYGVPYIPGSAVKGLAASYARNRLEGWDKKSDLYKTVFGTEEEAGYINFFDALYKPNSGDDGKILHKDIITVHHPDYYQNGEKAPADWDSPTPIPFLSATGTYLFALLGEKNWVEVVFEILKLALKEDGIGAKTSSGYGIIELNRVVTIDEDKRKAADLIERMKALSIEKIAGSIDPIYKDWKSLTEKKDYKLKVAKEILEEAKQVKSLRKKEWYKEMQEYINAQNLANN